jgi:diguanylate cyclase (GGDEF)-like protein
MISFRELLEKLLPLDDLAASDRMRVENALKTGVAGQIEQAAHLALHQLEFNGALRRIPADANGSPVVRFQARDRLDVITIHLPGPVRREGVISIPRASLPPQAHTSLEQVRRLLQLDDSALLSNPRSATARLGLIAQLDQVSREFLPASEVRLISTASDEGEAGAPFESALAKEALANPTSILYCADTARAPRLAESGRRLRVGSIALSAVSSSEGALLGHLEVLSPTPNPFPPETLAMVALLADCCGRALERAARLEKLVFIDSLTSAYNRAYFDLEVHSEMARAQREHSSLALCIADIDDFKRFNTSYGYEAGNQVLVQVAQALKRGVRPFDTVARWGGEEFAVLLTAPIHAADVVTISERLRGLVERTTVTLEGLDRRSHQVGVTVSIGVALFPDHAEEPAELWRAANQALLRAKRPPKNQVVFHQPAASLHVKRG